MNDNRGSRGNKRKPYNKFKTLQPNQVYFIDMEFPKELFQETSKKSSNMNYYNKITFILKQ